MSYPQLVHSNLLTLAKTFLHWTILGKIRTTCLSASIQWVFHALLWVFLQYLYSLYGVKISFILLTFRPLLYSIYIFIIIKYHSNHLIRIKCTLFNSVMKWWHEPFLSRRFEKWNVKLAASTIRRMSIQVKIIRIWLNYFFLITQWPRHGLAV